jgi:hypothetical protein
MKFLLLNLSLLCAIMAHSQKTEQNTPRSYEVETTLYTASNTIIENNSEAQRYLQGHFGKSNAYNFNLIHEINSLTGIHYTFMETYQGIEVYQGLIKLNTSKTGELISVIHSFQEIENQKESEWPSEKKLTEHINNTHIINETNLTWIKEEEGYLKALVIKELLPNGQYYENIYDANYTRLLSTELTAHFSAPVDTTALGFVYLPDPLTKTHQTYGMSITDNNDSTSPTLDNLRDSVELNLTFDNGIFYLENEFLKIVENSLPDIPAVTSPTPIFFFDRSESGFEDVNVFYHITNQQHYLKSLGFTNIVDYQIAVDCHGFGGADNSAFSFGTTPPSLVFGEGGVDDAEDSDVIIHEFGHAILHSTAPGTNFGSQRNAMDEAYGDDLAASYSSQYDDYHSDFVFNWDGHNEYWDGRLVVSTAMYPSDLQFNLYRDAPMWSSALMRIDRNIGRDLTTKIALEASYSFSSNMTMAQAAQLVISADSALNNSDNYDVICWVFRDKGMVNTCSVPRPGNLVGTSNIATNKNNLKVLNSENFALGKGHLILNAETEFEVKVYNLSGSLIFEGKSQNNTLIFYPEDFKTGTYIYKIQTSDFVETFKTIKY